MSANPLDLVELLNDIEHACVDTTSCQRPDFVGMLYQTREELSEAVLNYVRAARSRGVKCDLSKMTASRIVENYATKTVTLELHDEHKRSVTPRDIN